MANEELKVSITGTNQGVLSTFDQVSKGATKMGGDVERANKQAARSFQEAKKAGQDLAIGAAALGGAFVLTAQSATTQRREIASLGRAYGDNAGQILDWTQAIEDSSNVSDEAARKAALFASTLTQEYGLSLEQVQTLLQRTADVAEDRGVAFEDASQRIVAAIRGEAEGAEVLGIVANDASLGIDRMAASTTNGEKAQVRFNAIMDQTAESAGVAAEAADTTRGRVIDLAQSATDAGQAFADWTGPIGEAAAELGAFGLQAGLAAGGLIKLGSGVKGLAGAAGVGGLITSLGPVGLVAAAGLGAAALYKIVDAIDGDYRPAMQDATGATDTLRESINRMLTAGDPQALMAKPWIATMDAVNISVASTLDQLHKAELEFQAIGGTPMGVEVGQRVENLGNLFELWALDARVAKQELDDTNAALENLSAATGPGAEAALIDVNKAFQQLATGELKLGPFLDRVQEINAQLPLYHERAILASQGTDRMGASARTATGDQAAFTQEVKESTTILGDFIGTVRDAGAAIGDAAREQGTGDKVAAWLGLPPDWRARLEDLQEERQKAAELPKLESGAKEITATIIPAPTVEPPDPTIITFYNDLEIAYANVGRGALMASEANMVFWDTQNNLIASQGPYNTQLSEYSGQLGAIDAAVDQIHAKQEAGIEISAREQAILEGSIDATGRLTGGVEDATLARAEMAIQYAENMKVGDQLNENMQGQQEITGQLVGIVKDLILALDGVPEDVRTDIEMIGAEDAINQAGRLSNTLANIPLSKRIDIVTAFSQTGTPPGLAGLGGGITFQHGGIVDVDDTWIDHAQLGRISRGYPIEAGETGPEMARLPGGGRALLLDHARYVLPDETYISPSPASRMELAMNASPAAPAAGGFSGGGGGSVSTLNINLSVDVRTRGGSRFAIDERALADDLASSLDARIQSAIRSARYADGRS